MQLSLLFLASASFFHAILGFWTTITKRIVRATDYFYFLFGLVGLFIAAIAQGPERNESYVNLVVREFPGDYKELLSGTNLFIQWCDKYPWVESEQVSNFSRWILSLYGNKLAAETCESLREANTIADRGIDGQIPAFLERITKNKFYPNFTAVGMLDVPNRHMLDPFVLWGVSRAMEAIDYRRHPHNKELDSTMISVSFKYLLSQLWPFVLALAIALRITRTTADVTDWPI
jgi:hypothetical protein